MYEVYRLDSENTPIKKIAIFYDEERAIDYATYLATIREYCGVFDENMIRIDTY